MNDGDAADRKLGHPGPIESVSMVGRMAAVLRHEIATGVYPAASELPPEARLLERFGVSRPTAREALRVLEHEGLIRIARGARGGARVTLPEWRTLAGYVATSLQMREVRLSDLFEMLIANEPLAVRAIAARHDPTVLGDLAQCVAAQEFCGGLRDIYDAQERRFRALIFAHCGNEVLHLTGLVLAEVFEQAVKVALQPIPPLPWAAEHFASGVKSKQRLLKLMATGDADAAERLWRLYLKVYWKRLAAVVGKDAVVAVHSAQNPPIGPKAGATAQKTRRKHGRDT